MSALTDATTVEPADQPAAAMSAPRSRRRSAGGLLKPVGGLSAFVIILLCAVVSGYADPAFGPGAWQKSGRLLASLLAAYYLVNYGSLLWAWMIGRRPRSGHVPRVASRWVFVPVAVVMAFYARLTGIDPVLVFASVVAVSFGLRSGSVRSAVASVGGAVGTGALAVVAYLAYSALVAHPVQSFVHWDQVAPGDRYALTETLAHLNVAAGELFAITAVVACTSLVVGLLPFVSFSGVNVWRATRVGWVALYTLSVALFMTVVIPVGHEGEWTGPARWWVGLYVVYALVGSVLAALLRSRADDVLPG